MPTRSRSAKRRSHDRLVQASALPNHAPAWIKPQLATLVKEAPEGADWLHEIKLDGYRMHARLDAGRVQILTRRGNDWTDKYPAVAQAIAGLPAQNAYIEAERCNGSAGVWGETGSAATGTSPGMLVDENGGSVAARRDPTGAP
jgi:ATP-dependent DNA ligase